jgi:YHS domain-containing protein
MAFLIRVALVVLALYLLWRACGRLLRSLGVPGGARPVDSAARAVDELVQDPLCKLYVPRREAVVLREGGEDVFFCSAACRDRYVQHGSRHTTR